MATIDEQYPREFPPLIVKTEDEAIELLMALAEACSESLRPPTEVSPARRN
jgi:hypothetical protein